MKLYVCRGLPASGKSTKAIEMVETAKGKLKRVNRDLIREMLDNGRHSDANEKIVKQSFKRHARVATFSAQPGRWGIPADAHRANSLCSSKIP